MTVVNLNKARKARARGAAEKAATMNRVKFGRTKAERQAQAAQVERLNRDVDGHERER